MLLIEWVGLCIHELDVLFNGRARRALRYHERNIHRPGDRVREVVCYCGVNTLSSRRVWPAVGEAERFWPVATWWSRSTYTKVALVKGPLSPYKTTHHHSSIPQNRRVAATASKSSFSPFYDTPAWPCMVRWSPHQLYNGVVPTASRHPQPVTSTASDIQQHPPNH